MNATSSSILSGIPREKGEGGRQKDESSSPSSRIDSRRLEADLTDGTTETLLLPKQSQALIGKPTTLKGITKQHDNRPSSSFSDSGKRKERDNVNASNLPGSTFDDDGDASPPAKRPNLKESKDDDDDNSLQELEEEGSNLGKKQSNAFVTRSTLQAKVAEAAAAAALKDGDGNESPGYAATNRLERKLRADRKISFPYVLMSILEDDQYKDAVCWLPDGLSFAIDPTVFAETVIPDYYHGSKFDSFKRKLNRWGFRRVLEVEAPGTMTYYHRLFRRGHPGLLRQMNGGRRVSDRKQSFSHMNLVRDTRQQEDALLPATAAAAGTPVFSPRGGGIPPFSLLGMPFSGGGPPINPSAAAPTSIDLIPLEQRERLRLELTRNNYEEQQRWQKLGGEQALIRRAQQDRTPREMMHGPWSLPNDGRRHAHNEQLGSSMVQTTHSLPHSTQRCQEMQQHRTGMMPPGMVQGTMMGMPSAAAVAFSQAAGQGQPSRMMAADSVAQSNEFTGHDQSLQN